MIGQLPAGECSNERNAEPHRLPADHQFISFLVACSLSLRNLR